MKNDRQLTPQTLKGFRDFLPDEAARRLWLTGRLRQFFESFGFQPLETPALEYLETFSGQIGEEEKLFYSFQDQGGRQVALRYDQTVPACRVVAQYRQKLIFPFKRYQIQPVWRAEKPQKGRYREFIQCDADIFGESGVQADSEVILLSLEIYRRLGFPQATVLINDRTLFGRANLPYPVIAAIDKLEKTDRSQVVKEISAKGYSSAEAEKMVDTVLAFKPTDAVETIFQTLKTAGFNESWYRFEPTLARSFSYSTGLIWEVVIPGLAGSVLGGERFDELVSTFSKQKVPATGFGLGFDRTLEALENKKLLPVDFRPPLILITVFGPELQEASLRLAVKLRQAKINTELYTNPQDRLTAQLTYADRKEIAGVIILGPDELAAKEVTVKNLKTKKQEKIPVANIIDYLTENFTARD